MKKERPPSFVRIAALLFLVQQMPEASGLAQLVDMLHQT